MYEKPQSVWKPILASGVEKTYKTRVRCNIVHAILEEIKVQYAVVDIFVRTVFSVTTENFIGAIKDAPPPIEIP